MSVGAATETIIRVPARLRRIRRSRAQSTRLPTATSSLLIPAHIEELPILYKRVALQGAGGGSTTYFCQPLQLRIYV